MNIDILPLISIIIAYLLGCVPTAYWLVKRKTGMDIRHEGTGNIGARNSYDVTGNKMLGIAVMLIDVAKGALAVAIPIWLGGNFFAISLAGVFVVIGHCFNAFMSFKGGRGLATAAGVALMVNPLALILWVLMYFTAFVIIRRDVHVGSVAGTLATPMLLYTAPTPLVQMLMFVPNADITQFKLMVFMISIIIFFRHIEPMRELFKKMAEEKEESEE
ncbi:MAG: glycerol-3-phosphate acyltransferase [Candidatus Kapabacteria bacterium]|nr:glycerol-3-phosphate acyltransferase [Candidatus Kapabacteria bacterium]